MNITFSFFSDPIEHQLNAHGLTLADKADYAQTLADAILKLNFNGIITLSQANKAFDKLVAWIENRSKPARLN